VRGPLAVGLALCGFALGVLLGPAWREPPNESGEQQVNPWRPFTDDSAWNRPIPDDPVVDEQSDQITAYLRTEDPIANLYRYGIAIYEAGTSTPRHQVNCTEDWGVCGLEQEPVPIPEEAEPTIGSDGVMVVLDLSSGRIYDFWQAQRLPNGSWTASWGGVVDALGDGYTPEAGQTGAGVPRLAGVVRTFEIEQGYIAHALAFSTDNACRDGYRYPASKTDGRSDRPNCIPQGSRIQLDPSIDVEAIPGITPAETVLARALQTYGAYAVDNGGASMALLFETPHGGWDPYPGAGLAHDYFALESIPWERLRVLRNWDGS
jgi:hypothetical protein